MTTPIDPIIIADIQRQAAEGWSQRAIAAAVGVAQSSVSKVLSQAEAQVPSSKARIRHTLTAGVVLVGSDAHYWPGAPTTAHRGFVWACNQLQPDLVILNGDLFDGSRVSNWPRIGWDRRPKVKDELEEVQGRTSEIWCASPGATHIWTLGNHDARFENKLTSKVEAYEGVSGFSLKDHFPSWQPCWSVLLNGNTMIKHRFKGGHHAAYNNTVSSGLNIVTGHLHRLVSIPFSDYRGTRFAVECGTLADPYGPQFIDYTEDNPVNWQSGFAVLTYKDGILLPPELAYVVGPGLIAFQGAVYHV